MAMGFTPIENAETFVEVSARREGLQVIGRHRDGGRDLDVTLRDGDTCFEVRLRPRPNGYAAGVFLQGDHDQRGLPHRTGAKGVLEPVEARIVEVGPNVHADMLRFAEVVGAEIARAASLPGNATPIRQGQADRAAERIADLVSADPDSARTALAGALGEMFDAATLAKLVEAVDRHVDELPAPGLR
jgi:hypothetical protein